MDAWTRSGRSDTADRMLLLLKRLEQLAETTNNVNQAPDVVTWTCAISACQNPKQVQIMLDQLWEKYNNQTSAPVDNKSADSVTLSPMAQQLKTLQSKVSAEGVFDAEKVNEIKSAILSGQFKVNTEKVADGLIQSVKDMLGNKS